LSDFRPVSFRAAPDRAALIHRHGRVPQDARFGPPEPHLVRALVNGRSPRCWRWIGGRVSRRGGAVSRVVGSETE